jgi:putative toxin-antitoxin system antitoxin component (TIGR02293 family)
MATLTENRKMPSQTARRARARLRGGILGIPVDNPVRLVRLVQAGFVFSLLARFQKGTALPWDKIAHYVGIPPRTLTRRQHEGRLRADESERLLRVAGIFDRAVDLFEGDAKAAMQWLQTSQHGLAEETPLEFATTEIGAREVENLIARLEHGVFT